MNIIPDGILTVHDIFNVNELVMVQLECMIAALRTSYLTLICESQLMCDTICDCRAQTIFPMDKYYLMIKVVISPDKSI